MPILRNIRHETVSGRAAVSADFTIQDGREGCISVPVHAFEQYGEAAFMVEIEALERQARLHRYVAPEVDRYEELR